MKTSLIALYIGIVMVLAVATLVEQSQGTEFVTRHIYHSLWFCCLWGAIAVLSLIAIIRRKLWHRLSVLLLHGSCLIILAGAFTTFLFGQKGYMHLRVDEPCNTFVEQGSRRIVPLPFTLQLDSFKIACYPGTEAPADYISYLHHSQPVSMNNILVRNGYRFYQSSFDEDLQGSWLSVNHDPWGIAITYTGYALLGLSMMGVVLSRRSGFRRLLRHPLLRKGSLILLLLLGTAALQARTLPALTRHQADSLARTQVVYHDRVTPFNTPARDFLLKLYGKSSYNGLTPEQVIGGWLLRPDVWRNEPIIRIKSSELCRLLGIEGGYARLNDLFDGSTYRLTSLYQDAKPDDNRQSPLQKALVQTDEKVALILMLQNGTLMRPLPEDGSVSPLSPTRISAELLYNRLPFSKILFMACLALGFVSFFCLVKALLRSSDRPAVRSRGSHRAFTTALYLLWLFHLLGYSLRWYIGGRIPLSNGYETMQFLALCSLSVAALTHRRFPFMLPFGLLLAGFTLLVAHLGQMNPHITPLMPVLVSPWLSSHVSLIMMSYALFGFLMLNGILGLSLPRQADRLMILSRLILYPATFFLGAGIFLGAIWANVSWGRYWAWDPKEVWALITFLVYSLPFHSADLPLLRHPRFFHLYMTLAFLTVLMTYFGVNHLLGGMHSYGK